MTTLPPQTSSPNPLRGARLSFVGVGVMAEAIIAGLLRRQLVTRGQIVGSHPRPARREELQTHYGIRMVEANRDAATRDASRSDAATHDAPRTDATPTEDDGPSIVVLAVKPQRIGRVLQELRGALVEGDLVLSVVAGARMEMKIGRAHV